MAVSYVSTSTLGSRLDAYIARRIDVVPPQEEAAIVSSPGAPLLGRNNDWQHRRATYRRPAVTIGPFGYRLLSTEREYSHTNLTTGTSRFGADLCDEIRA